VRIPFDDVVALDRRQLTVRRASTGKPAYRLDALIVGGRAIGDRLGFTRHEMKGPWPLTVLFRRLARRSYLVRWEDVTRFDRPRIEIRHRARDLSTLATEDYGDRP
jgi:hypothetical protein